MPAVGSVEAITRTPRPALPQCHARASGGWLPLTCGAIVGPALGVWRGRQDGFPITGYCILAKQQQAAAAGLVWRTSSQMLDRSNRAASDIDLARFDLRIVRTMQSSGRPGHDS